MSFNKIRTDILEQFLALQRKTPHRTDRHPSAHAIRKVHSEAVPKIVQALTHLLSPLSLHLSQVFRRCTHGSRSLLMSPFAALLRRTRLVDLLSERSSPSLYPFRLFFHPIFGRSRVQNESARWLICFLCGQLAINGNDRLIHVWLLFSVFLWKASSICISQGPTNGVSGLSVVSFVRVDSHFPYLW